jgi:hypothetical protein
MVTTKVREWITKVGRRISEQVSKEEAREAMTKAVKEVAKEAAKEAIREAINPNLKGAEKKMDKSEVAINGIEMSIKQVDDKDSHKASPATDRDRLAEEITGLKEFIASILAEATTNASTANQLVEIRILDWVLVRGVISLLLVGGYMLHFHRRGGAAAEVVVCVVCVFRCWYGRLDLYHFCMNLFLFTGRSNKITRINTFLFITLIFNISIYLFNFYRCTLILSARVAYEMLSDV